MSTVYFAQLLIYFYIILFSMLISWSIDLFFIQMSLNLINIKPLKTMKIN